MNLGKQGEIFAREYLTEKGYHILEENFRTKFGEIDLIGRHGDELVFFEVKARRSTDYGLPCEAVNWKKQETIRRVANYYLMTTGNLQKSCRMDIIEIIYLKDKPYIRQISNVF